MSSALTREVLLISQRWPFFAEDLILAEERTTERDRKKITEGEVSMDTTGWGGPFGPIFDLG